MALPPGGSPAGRSRWRSPQDTRGRGEAPEPHERPGAARGRPVAAPRRAPQSGARASEDAVGGRADGAECRFLENRPPCQSANHRKNDNHVSRPSTADWGKHSGIKRNHQNSSSLELKRC